MVDDFTKKGTEGASAGGAIVDLSPATVKALPKTATNVLVAAGLAAGTTILAIAARSGIDQLIAKNDAKVLAAGGTPKVVNPDVIDGGMIAGGIGLAALSKNSYFRAAMVGISSGGLVSIILRKVPRLSAPFSSTKVSTIRTVTEEPW
jgi:hypothetical protein